MNAVKRILIPCIILFVLSISLFLIISVSASEVPALAAKTDWEDRSNVFTYTGKYFGSTSEADFIATYVVIDISEFPVNHIFQLALVGFQASDFSFPSSDMKLSYVFDFTYESFVSKLNSFDKFSCYESVGVYSFVPSFLPSYYYSFLTSPASSFYLLVGVEEVNSSYFWYADNYSFFDFSAFYGLDIDSLVDESYNNGYTEGLKDSSVDYDQGFTDGEVSGYTDGYDNGLAEGYFNGFNTGKAEGYTSGRSEGYTEGYFAGELAGSETGYDLGYDVGYSEGSSYASEESYNNGYTEGYDSGYIDRGNDNYDEGVAAGHAAGYTEGLSAADSLDSTGLGALGGTISATVDTVVNAADSVGKIDVFGITIWSLIGLALAIAIVSFIVRLIKR